MAMLMAEWLEWWRAIPSLEADELLAQYTVQLLGNPGWDLERGSILEAWRAMAGGQVARGATPNESLEVTEEDFKPGALRKNAWRVWHWLRSSMGRGIS
jgi:hypothetical protein